MFCFRYEWRKFPDLDPRMYEIMIKLSISLQFFQDPVIKGLVTEKILPRQINVLKVLERFIVFGYKVRIFDGWFRTFRVQQGKKSQYYGCTGRKQAPWLHLFITVFQCPIHGWHLCQVWKKSWLFIIFVQGKLLLIPKRLELFEVEF